MHKLLLFSFGLMGTLALFVGVLPGQMIATHSGRMALRTYAPATSILYTQQPCTAVYAAPASNSTTLTELLGGSDVTALQQISGSGAVWQHVHFWSGIDGYIEAALLAKQLPDHAYEGSCEFPNVPDPQSVFLPAAHGPWALPSGTTGTVFAPTTLYAQPDTSSTPVASLPMSMSLTLIAWAGDKAGQPWYHVITASGAMGWLWSGAVSLVEPDPVAQQVNGQAIWSPVAGKGMWFTNYLAHHSDMGALLRAAKLAGITHLYAEVAITQYGFYGQSTLERLLPAAHAAGIAVVAWVYPNLNDITADLRMTEAVAQYITKSGDHADGIATDIEEVDDTASVYTYGQLLRAMIGPDTLLVAAVYHPLAQPYYPYAAIAASWNVIAPMDYWHSHQSRSYSAEDVQRFVTASLTTIRAAMLGLGALHPLPVEELGQTYDMYSSDGTGKISAPTGAEITADMQTAQQLGCIGVSFFEWQTTTQQEWTAITQFVWQA